MNAKSWLALAALALTGLSWYYYTNFIRRCDSVVAAPTTTTTAATVVAHEPLEFNYNKNYPVTNEKWAAYRDSLIRLSKAGKNIEITGYYSSTEKNDTRYENLGLARADTIKDLLMPDIPASQIILRSTLRDASETTDTYVSSMIAAADAVKAPSADGGVVQKDDKTALIYFPSGSSQKELNKEVDDYLVSLAEKLKTSGGAAAVVGHTDNQGKYESNLALSKARAEKIKTILVAKGVDAAKLTTNGIADKEPIGDNNTDEGRRLNRRVEIKIQ